MPCGKIDLTTDETFKLKLLGWRRRVLPPGLPAVRSKFQRHRLATKPPYARSGAKDRLVSGAVEPSRLSQAGAGEGNRTLVCSLGSSLLARKNKGIAAKQSLFALNPTKGLRLKSKTPASNHSNIQYTKAGGAWDAMFVFPQGSTLLTTPEIGRLVAS